MEIYEQVAFSGQLLILFKSIILILFLFSLGYLIFPKKSNNIFLVFANSVGLSLIFVSSMIASVYTRGRTMLLPLLIVFIIVLFVILRAKQYKRINLKRIFNSRLGLLLLIFVLLFVINSFITQPYTDQSLVIINPDISVYANWSRHLVESGTETLPQEMLNVKSKQSFYHFIDLWFVGWGARVFNINNYVFYSLVYKPLLQFTLVLFLVGFAKRFNLSKGTRFLAVLIIFSTALSPFLHFDGVPWYLDLWALSFPLYHYIGTYFVSIYFFIVLSAFLFFKRENLAIILISLLGLINPLFIVVIPLFFLIVLTTDFLRKKTKILSYVNVITEANRHLYLLGFIISSLLVIFFKIFIIGNEGNDTIDIFRFKTYLVAGNILARTIIVSIVYLPLYIAGYVFLLKYCRNYRNVGIFFLYLFLAGSIFVSFVFENIQGNITQIINILWNFPLIVLGSFGFLLMLNKSKNQKTKLILLFLINSIWSVYNTFSEQYSSFHPIYRFNHVGTLVKYKDIDKLNEIVRNYGYQGGYFLNSAEEPRNLNVSAFAPYNALTREYSNSYRLNALSFDEYNREANKVYKKTILYDLSKEDNAEERTLAIIEKIKVNWLVVDGNHFIFPAELKPLFVKEYKFDNFSIFVKSKE